MKYLRLFLCLSILLSVFSCDKNGKEDDTPSCKLIQYGTSKQFPGEYTQELIYTDGQLSLRRNYSLHYVSDAPGDTSLERTYQGVDSIVYEGDFISRIFYKDASGTVIRFFSFENDGEKLISRREFDASAYFVSFSKDFLEYSEDHLSKIYQVRYYTSELENPYDTIVYSFNYDSDENLIRMICANEYVQGHQLVSDSVIREYSAYDDKINPYNGWPFPEMIDKSLSKNNWTKSKYIHKVNGQSHLMGNSEVKLEYDENNYPLVGEYDCNISN